MHKQSRNSRVYFVLFLALLLLLTGCEGAEKLSLSAAEPSPTPTATLAPTPTPEPTPSPTPYREIYPITFGSSNGASYQNEFFGLTIDLDDLWFAESKGELDLYNDFAAVMPEELREKEYLGLLNQSIVVYDYYALTQTGLQTIQIGVLDYTKMQKLYPELDDYLKGFVDTVLDYYRTDNAQFVSGKLGTVVIAGERQRCWRYSAEQNGLMIYSAYALIPKDKYVMSVFVSSYITDHVDEMLAFFHPIS